MSTAASLCWSSSFALSRSYLIGEAVSVNQRYDASPDLLATFRDFFVKPKEHVQVERQVFAPITRHISEQPNAKLALLSQIVNYLDLLDDWDGYGGKAASLATVMDTFHFLTRFPSTLALPKPMIGGAGVIGLYWEGNGCYASIDFDGSGDYCYIADSPTDESGEDKVPVQSVLPLRLAEIIAVIAGSL